MFKQFNLRFYCPFQLLIQILPKCLIGKWDGFLFNLVIRKI